MDETLLDGATDAAGIQEDVPAGQASPDESESEGNVFSESGDEEANKSMWNAPVETQQVAGTGGTGDVDAVFDVAEFDPLYFLLSMLLDWRRRTVLIGGRFILLDRYL